MSARRATARVAERTISAARWPICFAICFEPFHRLPRLRLRLARPRYSVASDAQRTEEYVGQSWFHRASSGSQLDPYRSQIDPVPSRRIGPAPAPMASARVAERARITVVSQFGGRPASVLQFRQRTKAKARTINRARTNNA